MAKAAWTGLGSSRISRFESELFNFPSDTPPGPTFPRLQ
jgi:hypothetical protein